MEGLYIEGTSVSALDLEEICNMMVYTLYYMLHLLVSLQVTQIFLNLIMKQ